MTSQTTENNLPFSTRIGLGLVVLVIIGILIVVLFSRPLGSWYRQVTLGDCANWEIPVTVWQDNDGDGLVDDGEPPVAGVSILAKTNAAEDTLLATSTDRIEPLTVSPPGCPIEAIYIVPPAGFCAEVPDRRRPTGISPLNFGVQPC